MEIVELRPQEVARYRSLRLRALGQDPSAFGSTLARERELPDDVWRERLTAPAVLVATVEGEDVGLATLIRLDDGFEIVGMWVDPARRGSGAAAALVQACLRQAASLNAARVELGVFRHNSRAVAFYERQGFVPTGEASPRDDGRALLRMAARPRAD